MNIDVAERLIKNIEEESRVEHNQRVWLSDHTNVFQMAEDTRWTCATAACAAGFIWLEEAPEGSVLDVDADRVFEPGVYDHTIVEAFRNYEEELSAEVIDKYFELVKDGVPIAEWAAEKLGISHQEANFIFYFFGSSEETIARIQFLMNGGNWRDYIVKNEPPF